MTHPIIAATGLIDEALKGVADTDPTFMSTSDKAAALRELVRLESRVAELRMRVLADAADVAAETGARDAADWLAHEGHLRAEDARAELRLAQAVERRWATLGAALRSGDVTPDQARVVVRSLESLTLRRLGDGTTRLSALLPDAMATWLATYLGAYANPRRDTSPFGAPTDCPADAPSADGADRAKSRPQATSRTSRPHTTRWRVSPTRDGWARRSASCWRPSTPAAPRPRWRRDDVDHHDPVRGPGVRSRCRRGAGRRHGPERPAR